MKKDLLAFVLKWRFEMKFRCVFKRKWRSFIAKKFIESDEYKIGKWKADDFIYTWETLQK